ncbi:MAG: hypothetical protein IKK58_05090 [Clostridia bacterium]|nr:hypothetical protein [Clostridia bacterium]
MKKIVLILLGCFLICMTACDEAILDNNLENTYLDNDLENTYYNDSENINLDNDLENINLDDDSKKVYYYSGRPYKRPIGESIVEKTTELSYTQLISQAYNTTEMSDFIKTHKDHLPVNHSQAAYLCDAGGIKLYRSGCEYELFENFTKRFPIECLRYGSVDLDNSYVYSIHKFDQDYLLFTFFSGHEDWMIKDFHVVMPTKVALTDEDILSLTTGQSTLSDVCKIDSSADKVYDPYTMYLLWRENAIAYGSPSPSEKGSLFPSNLATYHYTTDGNWYEIRYDYAKNVTIYEDTINDCIIVSSVEKIDPMPILEQDLPK